MGCEGRSEGHQAGVGGLQSVQGPGLEYDNLIIPGICEIVPSVNFMESQLTHQMTLKNISVRI